MGVNVKVTAGQGQAVAWVLVAGVVLACGALLWPRVSEADAAARLVGLRFKAYDTHTRVVLDLDRAVRQKNFSLSSPHRVVVDLPDTDIARALSSSFGNDPLLKSLRSGVRDTGELRLVIETHAAAEAKTTYLKPGNGKHHRIVLDIAPVGGADALALATGRMVTRPARATTRVDEPDEVITPRLEDIVVAIDAGHGGNDPGAVGSGNTFEKDVVLSIAKRLHRMLSRVSGIKPVLIRDQDEYVSLKERVRRTRDSQADLLISLHADAFEQQSASGSSVYVLSDRGADVAARRFLASKGDNLGGLHLSEQSAALARILVDLSQSASRETSVGVGEQMLSRIAKVNKLHKKTVERAGFVVLKAPDVPSVLVELGFISNPKEERRLRTTSYQERLAAAIGNGVVDHFKANPPFGTAFYRRYRLDVASN
ncbi:MAG: N-acetylmuramoyl-L-alanine amidase [Pseudomonadota bacterium]